MKLPVLVGVAALSLSSLAHADDGPAPGLTFALRETMDATRTAGMTRLGFSGFGLDVGVRVDDRLVIGATADWDLMLHLDVNASDPGDTLWSRARGGAFVRYAYEHDVRPCGGFRVRDKWVALMAGEQTSPGDDTHGRFAELQLGVSVATPTTGIGGYIGLGGSTEDTPTGATRRALSVALGMLISFG